MNRTCRLPPAGSSVLGAAVLLVALAACGEPPGAESKPLVHASGVPTNLVVLTLDTLRSDVLGSYGSTGGHTPELDALANAGVVFDRSLSPIATTFPSHASMFTGVYPRAHGLRWNGQGLDEEWTTLAEVLRAEGYATGAFVSYKAMVNRGGLGQGFETVSDPEQAPWDGARPGDETVALATDWLEQNGERPFLLWVHLFEPHSPYPLTDYATQVMGDYSGPFAEGITAEDFAGLPKGWWNDTRERNALRALYEGRVRELDRVVGDLMGYLDAQGLSDNTLVVAMGDHGQMLGEHGQVGHGPVLHQEVLATPMFMAGPGVPASRHVEEMVGVIDLMPTVLDLMGIAPPGEVQGRSLVPVMSGRNGGAAPPYFAEVRVTGVQAPGPVESVDDPVAVFKGPYKLVMESSGATLYDLRSDPAEMHPMSVDDKPDVARDLLLLARRHQQMERGQDVAHASEELDAETLAELKALGYLK